MLKKLILNPRHGAVAENNIEIIDDCSNGEVVKVGHGFSSFFNELATAGFGLLRRVGSLYTV